MNYIYVFPGQLAAVAEPTEIATILGSCVAVVLFDEIRGVAGLNHYLLPNMHSSSEHGGNRYGTIAIPALISKLEALGANRRHLKAKIYGGANVLKDVVIGVKVGEQNVRLAEEMLADLGIPIVESNTGGNRGRRIQLNTVNYQVKHVFMQEAA